MINLSRPEIDDSDRQHVMEVLSSPMLSIGPYVDRFEAEFAKIVGVNHVCAVNSGTSALHLGVRAAGVGQGDEVITSPFSFVASSNCAIFEKARPVFVDIDPDTLNLDEDILNENITTKTRLIIPVHIFGLVQDMDKIMRVASDAGVPVLEDACEALGAEYRGKPAGSFGFASAFGFYPNKQMTTGEGGMIVTNGLEHDKLFRSLRNQGRSDSGAWLEHSEIGYNYRMDEMSAALGYSQLQRIRQILEKRAKVAENYNRLIAKHSGSGIEALKTPEHCKRSWFVYVVKIPKEVEIEQVVNRMEEQDIIVRNYFRPIHLQPIYRKLYGYKEGDFQVCEDESKRTLAIPFFNSITYEEQEKVIKCLSEAVR